MGKEFFLYPVVKIQAEDEADATDKILEALAGVAQIPGWLSPAPLMDAVQAALDCLEEVLEDTDGPDGERIPNPLLVQLRAVAKPGSPLAFHHNMLVTPEGHTPGRCEVCGRHMPRFSRRTAIKRDGKTLMGCPSCYRESQETATADEGEVS